MPAYCKLVVALKWNAFYWSNLLKSQSPLTAAVLRAAGLLQQGQPFACVARAQQAADDAVCKQGTQAGAPGAVLTSISSLLSNSPSSAACVHRWC